MLYSVVSQVKGRYTYTFSPAQNDCPLLLVSNASCKKGKGFDRRFVIPRIHNNRSYVFAFRKGDVSLATDPKVLH